MTRLISSIPPTWSKVVVSFGVSTSNGVSASGPTLILTPLRSAIISSTSCWSRPVPSTTPACRAASRQFRSSASRPFAAASSPTDHQLIVRQTLLIEQYDVLVERGLGVARGHQRLGQDEPEQDVVRIGLDRLAQRGDPVVLMIPISG